ncbi:hypothetical protein CK477_22235 [Enterobacter cloacae]|nr:hypothetical protein CK477_22235 [Enterobacter cloacae]
MGNVQKKEKRVYLLGDCQYEMIGVSHILRGLKFTPILLTTEVKGEDIMDAGLIILSLSSAPLLGWGKYIDLIKKIKAISESAIIIAIVPSIFKELSLLKPICHVIDGENPLDVINKDLSSALNNETTIDIYLHGFKCFYDIYIQLAKLSHASSNQLKCSHYYRRSRMVKLLGINHTHYFNLLSIHSGNSPLRTMFDKFYHQSLLV